MKIDKMYSDKMYFKEFLFEFQLVINRLEDITHILNETNDLLVEIRQSIRKEVVKEALSKRELL